MKISCRDNGGLKEFREGITPEKNIECTRISFVETPRCRATAPYGYRFSGPNVDLTLHGNSRSFLAERTLFASKETKC